MNNKKPISRRDFLTSSTAVSLTSALRFSGASIALVAESATASSNEQKPFKVLSAFEARQLEAIAARIIPTTDTPGAREAGVVYFFDEASTGPMSGAVELLRDEIKAFSAAAAAESMSGASSFADLAPDVQDAFLSAREDTAFFQTMLFMTKAGFFGMNKYGGNSEHMSWDMIGYDGHHGAWQYPFGHYDAEVHGKEEPGHD